MTNTIEIKTIDIRFDGTNKYPNVYLIYKAVDQSQVDKLRSIIDVNGCTALSDKTVLRGIYNDVEHEDYFGKVQQKRTYEASGGEIVDLWVDDSTLYGKSRVGVEHVIADRDGNIKGSTYASAWLAYAQSQVNVNGGNTRDYIPNHIFTEFFEGKVVFPIKNVSVEMKYDHYITENTTDLSGVMSIRKFDLMRISFLLFSTPGQTYSGIESFEIRNFKNMKENKSIRCLCDITKLRTGDYLKNSKTNQIWSVTEDGENLVTTDIVSGEVLTTTLDELKANEDLDLATVAEVLAEVTEKAEELEESDTTIEQVRSMIRACSSCEAKTKARLKKLEVRVDEPVQSPDAVNDSTDVSVLFERVGKIEEAVTLLAQSVEAISNKLDSTATRSDDSEADIVVENRVEEVATPVADEIKVEESVVEDVEKEKDELKIRSSNQIRSMKLLSQQPKQVEARLPLGFKPLAKQN